LRQNIRFERRFNGHPRRASTERKDAGVEIARLPGELNVASSEV
jgi:hypothetical protein